MNRRRFVVKVAGNAVGASVLRSGVVTRSVAAYQRGVASAIDGLGEIHPDYGPELLDEIRASGVFGCVVTVGNPALQGAHAFDDMKHEIEAYDRHIASQASRLSRVTHLADLDRARARHSIALVYYTQNATPVGDDAARVTELHRLGVRIVQITYNSRNLLGDGCLERTNAGLSRFGIEVIERLRAARMLVDVSHCGEQTTMDAIAMSHAPVAITHTGCKAVFDHPRNKSDAALGAMAERGGVVGIYQINPYLGGRERNTLDDYIAHIEHAVHVCGVEHVGIGSDREHRIIPDTPAEKQKLVDELSRLEPATAATVRWPFFVAELNTPRRMEVVRAALEKRRMPSADIDRVLGGNWYRLFRDTIG